MNLKLKVDGVVFPVSSETSYALNSDWTLEMKKACIAFALRSHEGKAICEQTRDEIHATANGCYEWLKSKGVVI
jgi:hypothetical protein